MSVTDDLARWQAVTGRARRSRDELLDALRANANLVTSLTDQRWLVMRRARQAGASWEQIGTALGVSRQSAWEFLRRKLAEQ
jgi:Homeodomain-like domain